MAQYIPVRCNLSMLFVGLFRHNLRYVHFLADPLGFDVAEQRRNIKRLLKHFTDKQTIAKMFDCEKK